MFYPQDLKELLKQAPPYTLSLFLNVDPAAAENQSANPAWRTSAKNILRELDKGTAAEQVALWTTLRARIEQYLDDYKPVSKGLVLFYGQAFEQVYELPVAVENRAAFGTVLITPLLWVMEEYEPYLIVMVDRSEARFLTTYLGQIGFQDTLELKIDTHTWAMKTNSVSVTGLGRGSAVDDYQDRLEEHMNQQWQKVAEHIGQLMSARGVRRVILAGDEQAARGVQRYLTDKIAQALVGITALPMYYSAHEVLQHILPMALEYEYQQEMMLVEQVVNTAKAGGRASIGREAVLHALDQQRVELLLAPWPMPDERLAQEIPSRVFAAGGDVELVHGPAAQRLMDEGGLAARLYFAPRTPQN